VTLPDTSLRSVAHEARVPTRLRVLLVLPDPPLLEGRANGRAVIARLRGLQRLGVEVTAVAARQAFALPGDPPADLPLEVSEVAPHTTGWANRIDRLRAPRSHLARGAFGARVRELARQADVIHLEEIDTAACGGGLATPSLAQLNYLARHDRSFGPPWSRGFRDVVETVLAEREAVRRHRWLAANSPNVARALRAMAPRSHVVVAPLCLDPQDYAVAGLEGPPIAGMIGHAAWAPTAASVRRLITRVWPRVHRALPAARLRVAGRGMAALLPDASVAGVEVVGEVASAVEFLRGLSLLLYPIERGSGMKMKTLESLAVGLPIVTTPAGAEGIEGDDGVVIEQDDAALAAAAVELLADAAARQQRGRVGRAAFERRYTPVPATIPLVETYRRMAAGA
jgi:polysaccharide biosynthesis protein PslH